MKRHHAEYVLLVFLALFCSEVWQIITVAAVVFRCFLYVSLTGWRGGQGEEPAFCRITGSPAQGSAPSWGLSSLYRRLIPSKYSSTSMCSTFRLAEDLLWSRSLVPEWVWVVLGSVGRRGSQPGAVGVGETSRADRAPFTRGSGAWGRGWQM